MDTIAAHGFPLETVMTRAPILLSATLILPVVFSACDGQPVTERPPPPPGFKEGEIPPPTPDGGGRTDPLPPATAPVTPGDTPADRNHPAAPLVSPSASTADTPPVPPAENVPVPLPHDQVVPSDSVETSIARSPTSSAARDDVITAAVYRTLASHAGISANGRLITITTVAGTVMLRGTVADDEERNRVVATIGQVEGVRAIEDLLAVQGP